MLYYHMLLFCCWLVENPVQVVIDDLSASAGVHRVGSSAQGFHSRFWCRNIVELKPFCCFSCSVKQPVYQWAIVQDKAPFDDKIAAGPESRRPGFCLCRESATRSMGHESESGLTRGVSAMIVQWPEWRVRFKRRRALLVCAGLDIEFSLIPHLN